MGASSHGVLHIYLPRRLHSARGCSIKKGPHGIEKFHGQGAAGRSRQAAQTAFWRSAGVRREARCSRVPAGRIHSARGCSIKRGPHGIERFHGDGATGRTRTGDLLITNQLLYQLSHSSKCYSKQKQP